MRRILRGDKKADKSKEAKKREDLLRSINVGKQESKQISDKIKSLKQEITDLKNKQKEAKEEYDYWRDLSFKQEDIFKSLVNDSIPLQSKKATLEIRVQELETKKKDLLEDLKVAQKNTEKELLRLDKVKNERHKTLHEEVVSLEKEIARKQSELYSISKSEQDITLDIANKKREKIAMDSSLAKRKKELADTNARLAESKTETEYAEKKRKELEEELRNAQDRLSAYDKEIEERVANINKTEAEVESKRKQIVSLVKREERLNELVPAIKDLYAKAGIKIDI